MNSLARSYTLIAVNDIERALELLVIARIVDIEAIPDIDHIVDERKLKNIADRLRMLAAEAVS